MYAAFDSDLTGTFSLRDWARTEYGKPSCAVYAHAELRYSDFRVLVLPLGMSKEEVEFLFEGLSMENLIYDDGHLKKGSISHQELLFLDRWVPGDDILGD